MPYFALIYETVDNFVERRMPFRGPHLQMAREAHERGEIVLAGALGDPATRALIIFNAPDRAVVEGFVRRDPYVTEGLVKHWDVHPWAVVIGNTPDAR